MGCVMWTSSGYSRDPMNDETIRERILRAVEARLRETGGILTRHELTHFRVGTEEFRLVDQSRGIWNPKWLDATLSILTSPDGPYTDEVLAGGLVRYAYRAGGAGGDNTKLRQAHELGVPLIYLQKIATGAYVVFPRAYVVKDDRASSRFLVAVDDALRATFSDEMSSARENVFALRELDERFHQPIFRARVLHAYETRCAICRLGHGSLLDAAHILPTGGHGEIDAVSAGLSLCKLHHAAYDQDFLGITPDATIELRKDLLEERDGPMLEHGLQRMHGAKLFLPKRRRDRPNRDALAERYERFQRSA